MSRRGWIDITRTIDAETPVFPGDPPPRIESFRDGAGVAMTRLVLLTHTGTHLDLPAHVIPDTPPPGNAQILRAMIGAARVVRVVSTRVGVIPLASLSAQLRGRVPRRLLIRGASSAESGWCGLSPDAARWLAGHAVLVGTDAQSVDPPGGGLDVHRILLGAGTLVLENLDLEHVAPGTYHLFALPVRLGAADGAPVRAVLQRRGKGPSGG